MKVIVSKLEPETLDHFLALPAWKMVAIERLHNFDAQSAKNERALICYALKRLGSGLVSPAIYDLLYALEIAASLGRATIEQHSVIQEICDALR